MVKLLFDKITFLALGFTATDLLIKPHGCQLDEPAKFSNNHQRNTIVLLPQHFAYVHKMTTTTTTSTITTTTSITTTASTTEMD